MIHDVEQRSPEWFALRTGIVTASRVSDVMAMTKSGPGASRKNYMADLVAERLTGERRDGFTNAAMQWGTDMEPEARAAYEFMTDADVAEVGFATHDKIAGFGASPDGIVGDAGMVEIKCPNTATHIDTLLTGKIDRKYLLQMQAQMACTGRAWCDFVSYDPRLPGSMRLFVQRVDRDDALIAGIEVAVAAFNAELEAQVSALLSKYGEAA
jgi:putative phage-type endonuclease